jgi:hypothetical protein
LQLAYLLGALAVIVAVQWFRGGRTRPERRVMVATIVGLLLFLGWGAVQARPYLQVLKEHPEARRTVSEVTFFSPPASGFLAAPSNSFLWSRLTSRWRDPLPWIPEQTLFLGVIAPLLALYGLLRSRARPWLRFGLGIAAVVTAAFAMGFRLAGGRFTYRFLYQYGPGWQSTRTPGRIVTLTALAVALLAALGASALISRLREGSGRSSSARRGAIAVVGVGLVALVLLDGAGRVPHPRVPPVPAGQLTAASPQLHLPSDDSHDVFYMYWSTDGFPDIVNGTSGFVPTELSTLRNDVANFPDGDSVSLLRSMGVKTVIVHRDLTPGTPWDAAATKPIAGLGITHRIEGSVVVYELGPGP